ncbi:MAG: hypothetical protein AVDCRST_MAG49-2837, partial [uncultured Thermomicrobiales bacterium]
ESISAGGVSSAEPGRRRRSARDWCRHGAPRTAGFGPTRRRELPVDLPRRNGRPERRPPRGGGGPPFAIEPML